MDPIHFGTKKSLAGVARVDLTVGQAAKRAHTRQKTFARCLLNHFFNALNLFLAFLNQTHNFNSHYFTTGTSDCTPCYLQLHLPNSFLEAANADLQPLNPQKIERAKIPSPKSPPWPKSSKPKKTLALGARPSQHGCTATKPDNLIKERL